MKKILLTLLSFGSLLTSCKQTEVKPEITVQNISGNYILKDLRMSATGVPEQDAFSSLPKCEIDDLYELKADNSFEYIDTGVVCNPSSSKYEGNWNLEGDSISFYGQTGAITKFDGNIMEVTTASSDSDNVYVMKSTYARQQ